MTDKFPEMACITGKSSKESNNSTISLFVHIFCKRFFEGIKAARNP
jgi:hypothetical protein